MNIPLRMIVQSVLMHRKSQLCYNAHISFVKSVFVNGWIKRRHVRYVVRKLFPPPNYSSK